VLAAGLVAAITEAGGVDGGTPGVLAAGPAATTTEAGDIDGGPPRGCSQDFQQRPPPKLETSTMGPLGVLAVGLAVATTDVEDVDGGALGVAGGRSGSGHH
jgi:hypothetical protein